jgi:hypothetical protein
MPNPDIRQYRLLPAFLYRTPLNRRLLSAHVRFLLLKKQNFGLRPFRDGAAPFHVVRSFVSPARSRPTETMNPALKREVQA